MTATNVQIRPVAHESRSGLYYKKIPDKNEIYSQTLPEVNQNQN